MMVFSKMPLAGARLSIAVSRKASVAMSAVQYLSSRRCIAAVPAANPWIFEKCFMAQLNNVFRRPFATAEVLRWRYQNNKEYFNTNLPELTKGKSPMPWGKVGSEQQALLRSLRTCTDIHDWQGALEILRQQVPSGTPGEPDDWGPVRRAVLHCCCRARVYEEAMDVFRNLPVRDVMSYNMVINMCGQLKRLEEAYELFSQMEAEGIEATGVSHNSLMTGMASRGMYQEALAKLEELKSRSDLHSSTNFDVSYTTAMNACARAGRYEEARKLHDEIPSMGLKYRHPHFNVLLIACAVAPPNAEAAREVWQKMRSAHLVPREQDYNAMIQCCRESIAECWALFDEMARQGLRPNEELFASLVNAAVLNGDANEVKKVVEVAHTHGIDTDNPSSPKLRLEMTEATELLWSSENINFTGANAQPLSEPQSFGSVTQTPLAGELQLPSGWGSALDPSSGHRYYWQLKDPAGSVTWEAPQM